MEAETCSKETLKNTEDLEESRTCWQKVCVLSLKNKSSLNPFTLFVSTAFIFV